MAEAVTSRIVLGTAGHIDHGKTALVKALTGVDTDRLKEEKERGITIELGFAALTLPNGRVVSVVDVPGHERFVRNMVAGASGIDFVLFVVAADEGVMPQTREHLDICSLLGIRTGIVAITKSDLVEADLMGLVKEELGELFAGTFLESAPMVPVSSLTGEGIPELKELVRKTAEALGPRPASGLFRLPVDRVFTIKGFGTVATGTALSGSVKKEDEVEILPGQARAKVRGLEVHGAQVDKGYAGNRVAMNFSGLSADEIQRGDTVVHPGTLKTTRMADAKLRLLSTQKKPLEKRTRLRLHVDTRDLPVVVSLLDREKLMPGETAYVQLRSAEQFLVCPGDHFVLRSYSPAATVGGGVVLDSAPQKHKGLKPEVLETLKVLDEGGPGERLAAFLLLRKGAGLTPQETQAALGVTLDEARNLLQAAVRNKAALVSDRKAQTHVHLGYVEKLMSWAVELLGRFHQDNPLKKGMGREELRSKFPDYIDEKLVAFTLERLTERALVVLEGDRARLASFEAKLMPDDENLQGKIMEIVRRGGFEAPTLAELAGELGETEKLLRPVLDFMVAGGMLVRTKENFYFEASLLAGLCQKVVEHFETHSEITVAEIKEFTKVSRKYLIPLAEYLDSAKITLRNGDVRIPGQKGRQRK